jgi:hypothetical protein
MIYRSLHYITLHYNIVHYITLYYILWLGRISDDYNFYMYAALWKQLTETKDCVLKSCAETSPIKYTA